MWRREILAFIVLVHVATCTIFYYGPTSDPTAASVKLMIQQVKHADGTPVNVLILPDDVTSAIAVSDAVPSPIAAIVVDCFGAEPLIDRLQDRGILTVIDSLDLPHRPLSPTLYYGGPSFVDQIAAHLITRKQLPTLDVTNVIIVLDEQFASGEEVMVGLIRRLTDRDVIIVTVDAGETEEDVATRVADTAGDVNALSTMICMVFSQDRSSYAISIIRRIYHPNYGIQFMVAHTDLTALSDNLAADPLPPTTEFDSSIEAYRSTPLAMADLVSSVNAITGASVKPSRIVAFITGATTLIAMGMAEIHFTTMSDTLAGIAGFTEPINPISGLIVGPNSCPTVPFGFDPCVPCHQIFRHISRVVVGVDGTLYDPEESPIVDFSYLLCINETVTTSEHPFVIYSSHHRSSFLINSSDSVIINGLRQVGMYAGAAEVDMLGGIGGRAVLPQTLRTLNITSVDSLLDIYHRSFESFIFVQLWTDETIVRPMLASIDQLRDEHGISLLLWGTESWDDELLLTATGRHNPHHFAAAPRWRNMITATCRIAAAAGQLVVISLFHLTTGFPSSVNDISSAAQGPRCTAMGVPAGGYFPVDLSTSVPLGADLTPEALDFMTETIQAELDKRGLTGPFTMLSDQVIPEKTAHEACVLMSRFPKSTYVFWATEPNMFNETICPDWRGRVTVLHRWPHRSIESSLSNAFFESVARYNEDGSSFLMFDKWSVSLRFFTLPRVQTRLLLHVLVLTTDVFGELNFDKVAQQLYGGSEYVVEGTRFGPYSREPGDATLAPGDICNTIAKTLYAYDVTGDASNTTFVPTAEFGFDPVLDWHPFCDFFIPPVVVGATSLIALWITLGCVLLALAVSCCCCCVWCCLITIIAAIIARQRRTSERYHELRDQAQEAVRQKTMFVSNMSHELRAPLNAIIGTIDLVKDTPLSDTQRQSLQIIGASSAALLAVVNDVLFAARLASKQVTTNTETFQLAPVVEQAIATVAQATKPIDYLIYYLPGTPITINCDKRRLEQVLTNILSNATKFTAAGCVRVVIGPDAGSGFGAGYDWAVFGRGGMGWGEEPDKYHRLRFEVDDSGVGISPSDYELVFDRFIQLEHGMAKNYGGTGLGLHIAKQLLKLVLHGTITAGSSPDLGGARFTFTAEVEEKPTVWPHADPDDVGRVALLDQELCGRHARSLASLLLMTGFPVDCVLFGTVNDVPTAECTVMCAPSDPTEGLITTAPTRNASPSDTLLTLPFSVDTVYRAFEHKLGIERAATPVTNAFVVVADDEAINLRMLSAFLTKCGAQHEVYANGAELLAGVGDGRPDIAVVDYHMPVMEGPECARRLRDRLGADILLILMTGDATYNDEAGIFDAILIKPVRLADFKKAIGAVAHADLAAMASPGATADA